MLKQNQRNQKILTHLKSAANVIEAIFLNLYSKLWMVSFIVVEFLCRSLIPA